VAIFLSRKKREATFCRWRFSQKNQLFAAANLASSGENPKSINRFEHAQ